MLDKRYLQAKRIVKKHVLMMMIAIGTLMIHKWDIVC